ALSGFTFALSLYLQSVRGLTATEAGLSTVATGILSVIAAFWAGNLVARHLPRLALVLAGAIIAISSIFLLLLEHAPVGIVFIPVALFGLGYGLISVPANSVAEAALPASDASRAASLMSTSRQVGRALG